MSLVSLSLWAGLTLVKVRLVPQHWTNFHLLIILPGTPEVAVGVIMDGINVLPRLTT